MRTWKNKSDDAGNPICPVCAEPVSWAQGTLQRWELPADVAIDRGFWLHPRCRDAEAAS
jgi:hypothetical protein